MTARAYLPCRFRQLENGHLRNTWYLEHAAAARLGFLASKS
ncbi:hypothetical protein [Streptomyces sp. NPDC093984]